MNDSVEYFFRTCTSFGTDEELETLIANGADVNATYKNFTPLSFAVIENQPSKVKILLKAGADPNVLIKNFGSLLCCAVHEGFLDILSLLLEHGAKIDNGTLNPFLDAVKNGNKDAVDILLKAGVDINMKDEWDINALILAINSKKYDIVRFLLKHGADPTIECLGYSALQFAIKGGHKEIEKDLSEAPPPLG